jgi:hypothetical protein
MAILCDWFVKSNSELVFNFYLTIYHVKLCIWKAVGRQFSLGVLPLLVSSGHGVT